MGVPTCVGMRYRGALVLPVTQAQVVQRVGEDRDDEGNEQVLLRFHGISLLLNCPDAIRATAEAASMSV